MKKINEKYYGIKNVFGELVGKEVYPDKESAEIDRTRLVEHAFRQSKAAVISGNRDLIDSWDAEYQRTKHLSIIEICIIEIEILPVSESTVSNQTSKRKKKGKEIE